MSAIGLFCRNATAFTTTGALDEQAVRDYLARFVDARIGIVPGSSGSGEGFSLSLAELKRLFEICVAECRGKVVVNGNPSEQHTAKATLEALKIAASAGVDIVTLFPLAGWHHMRPTDLELTAYYDNILCNLRHPVALAANPVVGYAPKSSILADVTNRYPQVESLILVGMGDNYFIDIKAKIKRNVSYYAPLNSSLHWLSLGAAGMYATEANLIPKTHRAYVDCYESGDAAGLVRAYTDIKRVHDTVQRWNSANVRLIKMHMKVFKLPGGEGGMREPYAMPPQSELDAFRDGLLALDVPEINEQAKAAGLK